MNIRTLIIGMAIAATTTVASAQTTWTGATDTAWSDGSNWDAGTPGDAIFTGALTANLPDIGTGVFVNSLEFQSGDWVISSDDGGGGLGTLNVGLAGIGTVAVTSSVGVNTIDANILNTSYNNDGTTYFVDAGSTLVINGTFSARRIVHLTGTGSFVFGDSVSGLGKGFDTDGMGNYYFNSLGDAAIGGPSIGAGSILGGTAPVMRINQYNTLTLDDGGIFSPGGDGTHGADISTVMLRSASDTIRAGFNMGGSNSQLVMDIGTTLGDNDQVVVGFLTSDMNLNNSILALRGTTIQDGDYTLISETIAGSDYTGSFSAVTFNGSTLDPANYTLNYNADDVTISIVGLDVSLLVGDMNDDGVIDNLDINPFVQALTDPAGYQTAFGLDPNDVGDINDDGVLDNLDINPFVALLTGPAAGTAVPEPASLALIGLGGLALLRRRR